MELRPEKNGFGVLDVARFGPYQLWDADLWKCPGCGFEVVLGFGCRPIIRHEDSGFEQMIARYRQGSKLVENQSE